LKEESFNVQAIVQSFLAAEEEKKENLPSPSTQQVILETEVDVLKHELARCQETSHYQRTHYTVAKISAEVLRMETGLPTVEIFNIVVDYAASFKDSICYYAGWRVDAFSFEDQMFLTLMKLRQNYTNLHIAELYACSVGTISNVVLAFIDLLHDIFFKDIMTSIPSRDKNKLCAPSSFSQYTSCRIVIDCTDVEIATPGLMSQQSATYSSYRGMNSFKVLVGVAPNAVITFVKSTLPRFCF
jgi:hypothetical protein